MMKPVYHARNIGLSPLMASLPPTILESLMKQISGMPLWIKQVIYAQLKGELEHAMSKATVEAFGAEHTLQLWVPDLSREGGIELETPSGNLSSTLMKLLHLTRYRKNVANITVMNNWSLEHCSLSLKEAIEKKLINRPSSGIVLATIEYLAGGIRLGEYLVKINRVTAEQLDQALRTQKYIEESMGERTGIANVMINLGYIRKEDTEGILFLKEESKKPFQGLPPSAENVPRASATGWQAPQPQAPIVPPQAPPEQRLSEPTQRLPGQIPPDMQNLTRYNQTQMPPIINPKPMAPKPSPSTQAPTPPEKKRWGLF